MIPQCHTVPEERSVAWLVGLPVAILSDDVLNRVQLSTAVVRVDHDLLTPQDLLLAPVHQVVLVHTILLPLARVLLLAIRTS